MQLSLIHSIFFLVFAFSLSVQAADILPIYSTTRALGMGNAQYGVITGPDSIFYNPAGLARTGGIGWRVLGAGVGVGDGVVSNIDQIQNTESGSGFAETLNEFYGDQVFVNASGSMALTLPYISFMTYNQTYASLTINNPVYPELPTRFINDYGYAVGLGLPVLPFFHLGVALKRVKRSGVDTIYRVSSLTELDVEVIKSDFTQHGVGYGMDLGGNFIVDLPLVDVVLSGVWQNIGDTTFRSSNGSNIPVEKSNMGIGAAVVVDLPLISIAPSLDITHLNRSEIQLMRKINFGVEVGLPLIDLRAGFNQGYYSAGVGVGFGPLGVNAATYGVELGEYPGQIEDRRYMVEMSIELGIGSLPFGGSSSSSSGGGKSAWGGQRLKQRR